MSDNTDGARGGVRNREQALAEIFVSLADTLVDDYDVVELLEQLVTACVDLVGTTSAGLLLDDQKGNLTVVASSSEETRLLEMYQLQSNEGPCLDCVRGRSPIVSHRLADDRDRWPRFVPAALDLGVRSVVAVPLRLREETIGGLNLFHSGDQPLSEDDQQVAQALADIATIGILHQRSAVRSSMMAEQLQHALNSRVAIEQAKGVLAERNRVSMDVAFGAMRRFARNHNQKLTDVALAVIAGDIVPDVAVAPTA